MSKSNKNLKRFNKNAKKQREKNALKRNLHLVKTERNNPFSKISPNYKKIVEGFEGSPSEWYELILNLHELYGYGFDYESLDYAIELRLIELIPQSKEVIADKSLEPAELAEILLDKHPHLLSDMYAQNCKQASKYWDGELEDKGLITYGAEDSDRECMLSEQKFNKLVKECNLHIE